MRALITGINGFVGPYLKKHLLGEGFEVVGTDISEGADYKVDLLDAAEVDELVEEVRPDYFFHLAAQSSVKLSFEKPEFTKRVNVEGTRNLLDAVKKHAASAKVLVVSSADVYGVPEKVPLTEDSKTNPVSPYGESKLEQEKLALGYGNVVVSRSFSHIGPGQKELFVCSDFAKQIAEERDVICTGNIDVKRDFTDVRDMVKAYLLALQKGKAGEIYNICSGKSYSIRWILEKLLGFSSKKIEIETKQEKMRENEIMELVGNNSKFCNATGWKAEIKIEDTLKEILDYWRGHCQENL
jgi:GDP-4-dehydro-6-deoxy-D-mannose reductase